MTVERYFFVKPLRKLIDSIFFWDKEPGFSRDGSCIKRHCEKSIMFLEQKNIRKNADYEIWDWGNNLKKRNNENI